MPNPIRSVTPDARNFNGTFRKEIANTIPHQAKTTADHSRGFAGSAPSGVDHDD